MKENYCSGNRTTEFFKKFLRIMKITVLIIILGLSSVFATPVHSQTEKVNLVLHNATLKQILSEIEKQSSYNFFYNDHFIDLNQRVSLNLTNTAIREVLMELFHNTNLTYSVMENKLIVITPKEFADKLKVQGVVTDKSGNPLPGVIVTCKGTNNRVVTDVNGKYLISNIPEKGILQFSFIGMKKQDVNVEGKSLMNVIMESETSILDEVVVVGYGAQKKVNLTGAVSTVKSEALVKSPAASTVNTLAGILPGLVVKQTSGQPGFDQSNINIRNFGNALIIVDGVEQSFNNIDPSEIESISILKDASAAIYGARAGNGVILVTTKRGTLGKPVITYNSTITGQAFTNFPVPVNAGQYATLYREAQINAGIPTQQLKYSEQDIAKYFQGTDPQYPNTNWTDVIMKKWAPQQQHNITITGGNEKVKYYSSLGYLNQGGMFKGNNTGYERYNVRSNLDVAINSALTMSLDLTAIKENVKQSSRPSSQEWFWMDFLDCTPTSPASFPDKTKVPHISPGPYNAIINTSEELGGYDKTFNTSLNGAVTLKYKVKSIDGLNIKFKMNYSQVLNDEKLWRKQCNVWDYDYASTTYSLYGTSEATQLTQTYNSNQIITGQFSFNYDHVFNEKHSISALLLYEGIDYSGKNFSAFRQNYLTSAIDQLFAGGTIDQQANGSASESGRESLVSRFNYGYKGKYLMEATVRYDGSPNFPKNKRWGTFPSISAGWRISEESFIKDNISWISNLKLRGGISQTGYDGIAAYQYLTGYRFSGLYVVNGKEVPALSSIGLPNTNITWETMTLSNIGLDFSVFNGKIYSEIDVFQRFRDNMLGTRLTSLPNTFGASLPDENINSQRTRGFEILLGHKGDIGDFKYDISGNISYARSKWVHFDEVDYTDPDQIRIYKKSGQWVDAGFGYKSDGLFTSQSEIDNLTYDEDGQGNKTLKPGDIKYLDLNHDGKIDWRDYAKINDGGTPHIMYGININLKYKRFDFSMLAQGAADYTVQLEAGNINIDSQRTPTMVIWNERWTSENNNKNAIIPEQKFGQTTNNWNSDYWNKNASYLRLKNVNLGYTFDPRLLHKVGIDQLRIFITGTNLFTISKLQKYGLDPESPDATRGWTYPIQKTLSIGLNVNL